MVVNPSSWWLSIPIQTQFPRFYTPPCASVVLRDLRHVGRQVKTSVAAESDAEEER